MAFVATTREGEYLAETKGRIRRKLDIVVVLFYACWDEIVKSLGSSQLDFGLGWRHCMVVLHIFLLRENNITLLGNTKKKRPRRSRVSQRRLNRLKAGRATYRRTTEVSIAHT